jgi:hypothetical protein
LFAPAVDAGNDVLGQIELEGATQGEKDSGVWVDGQYVGNLRELQGAKKIPPLPGKHGIIVRRGYVDFVQRVTLRNPNRRNKYAKGHAGSTAADHRRDQAGAKS